jgi:transcriptional regulator with XRE-family HTH domain
MRDRHRAGMDDARLAASLRACRRRQRLRQVDVARRSGVPRETIGELERDGVGRVRLDALRAVAEALGLRLDIGLRWRGGDLDRVVNAGHAALHEAVARYLAGLLGWTWVPEVSFSIYGERGIIDMLAWHGATRCLLVIELKTELVDPQALVATMSTRVRLARQIAHDHGWLPEHVAAWVIVVDTKSNRRRLAQHARLLRTAFPADGRRMAGWMRHPAGTISALSFWSNVAAPPVRADVGLTRRVRVTSQPPVDARTTLGPDNETRAQAVKTR